MAFLERRWRLDGEGLSSHALDGIIGREFRLSFLFIFGFHVFFLSLFGWDW